MKKLSPNPIQFRRFLDETGVNFFALFLPTVLAVLAALFEGASLGLLIPTIKGIIQGNANFVREIPVLRPLIVLLPERLEHRNAALFPLLIGLVFMTAVAKNALQYTSALGIAYQTKEFSHKLRTKIYRRYLSFGKLFFDQNSLGHLQQVLTGYTGALANQLQVLNNVLYTLFTLVIYLSLMFVISWQLTLFVMVASPILHYSVDWLIQKIKKSSEFYTESYNRLAKNISNALTCIPLVKAYTLEPQEEKRFAQASDEVKQSGFSIDKKTLLIAPLQDIVVLSLILFLVGLMAFLLIREKTGDLAGFMVFFILLRRSAVALGVLGQIQAAVATTQGPVQEIMRILDDQEKYFVPDGRVPFVHLKEGIQFNHLNFSYPRGIQVLRDVSFSIEKGKMTAIVGPSGAGKTTLINLIMRFYDSPSQSIQIDGMDIRDFTLESLREKMALVSQETFLFNASFRANLNYGLDGMVTDQAVEAAVKKSRLYDLLAKLPYGLDTEIGERGVKLSGGEKQRLSIARAILKGSEILILDEATSALDTETERLIQEAIDDAIRGRTAIVIAHRLSTIKHADKIVVIEDGRVVEEGSLNELLAKKGRFYHYWEAQKFY